MKILLADDHMLMRHGLRAILEKEEDTEVVGEACNGREAIEIAGRTRPTLVLMDVTMAGLNGIDATRAIVARNRDVKVIGLSINTDRRYVRAMFVAGAVGYVPKGAPASDLLLAIRTVMQNKTYVSPAITAGDMDIAGEAALPSPRGHLSLRQREVLQLLAEGGTSKNIAFKLRMATATVESHRREIMSKLHIHTIAELTKYAVREGLTGLEG